MELGIFSFFPIIMVWAIVGITLSRARANQKKQGKKIPSAPSPASVSQAKEKRVLHLPNNAGEGHVSTIGPDGKAQLEQLETLKAAGILDDEEYRTRKARLLRNGKS